MKRKCVYNFAFLYGARHVRILIYSDNVSSNNTLYYALGRLRGKENVAFVNAKELMAGELTPETDLFVMPGGASRYKSAKLSGQGNKLIKEYVAKGGKYLGICAGAYFACNTTHWAKDQPYEIVSHSELRFFPGLAEGPIDAFAQAESYNGTTARLVNLEVDGVTVRSLYLGGCYFSPTQETGYEVLGTFADLPDTPPAIVGGEHGEGAWVLCSTHPEYDAVALDLIDFNVVGNDYEDIATLGQRSTMNLALLDLLLKKLDVTAD